MWGIEGREKESKDVFKKRETLDTFYAVSSKCRYVLTNLLWCQVPAEISCARGEGSKFVDGGDETNVGRQTSIGNPWQTEKNWPGCLCCSLFCMAENRFSCLSLCSCNQIKTSVSWMSKLRRRLRFERCVCARACVCKGERVYLGPTQK